MSDNTDRQRGRSPIDELPLTGESLALDLVNTTYIRGGVRGHLVDALTTPEDLRNWLVSHQEVLPAGPMGRLETSVRAGRGHLERFLELRGSLRSLASALTEGEAMRPSDLAVVNDAAGLAVRWRELRVDGGAGEGSGRLLAADHWPEPDAVLVLLGATACAAVELFGGPDAAKLRACEAPGCILYFVRRHARRAWCTTGCGNRVRVSRHSRRSREADR
ncbi:CGNR zinc finger domain-containing protein [Streptomyces sp. NPDC059166]|uniref:CGNR zinc finger domain-containing protein n=1 Tax=Streptomyces sp. NPDC059166 TaxID=3346752 RepID=UPI003687ADEB